MASHLLNAGHVVHVHNRTPQKAQPLLDAGARWHSSAGDLAAAVDIVITMLGFPTEVEAAYLGAGGIIERARPGALLIDMTTSSPKLAQRIAAAAANRGLESLDAPVSGGDIGAREARLVIMVGGEASTFERAQPVLELMGKNISRLGPVGAGQHCKTANQVAVAVGMVAWCEALAYARQAGLSPDLVHASISGGAAGSWALSTLAPRALSGDFAPGFYVKHMLKDLRIALESAAELELELPGLAVAQSLYNQVTAQGWEEEGTQALYRLYLTQQVALT
jgi:3-hydroxyisobutyrate dehydrogenase